MFALIALAPYLAVVIISAKVIYFGDPGANEAVVTAAVVHLEQVHSLQTTIDEIANYSQSMQKPFESQYQLLRKQEIVQDYLKKDAWVPKFGANYPCIWGMFHFV